MITYLALLRGVNVGGNAKLPMSELRESLEKAGLENVKTYIQSGNAIFTSRKKDKLELARLVGQTIKRDFAIDCGVVVFSQAEWAEIIAGAPSWWGKTDGWKHNLWVLIPPFNMHEVITAIGTLKPGIESIEPGKGVIYQSMSFEKFGQTSTGKISSSPVYKKMTIRNYNTSSKLLDILKSSPNT